MAAEKAAKPPQPMTPAFTPAGKQTDDITGGDRRWVRVQSGKVCKHTHAKKHMEEL